jgi:hypothetical protein
MRIVEPEAFVSLRNMCVSQKRYEIIYRTQKEECHPNRVAF